MDRHQQNRYRGHMNRVNGAFFEYIIEGGCQYYRNMGIADIEKNAGADASNQGYGRGKVPRLFPKSRPAGF